MENKFSIWVPLEIEKSKSSDPAKRYDNMRFKGVASNPNTGVDADGEWLDPRGFDLNDFLSTGTINYHHLWKKSPAAIIGEPIAAKITKGGELYVEGKLWKSSPLARDVYDVAEVMEKDSDTRRMGFSIEGIPLERDPNNEKKILKAKITNLAITPAPKNKGTRMELVKGGFDKFEYEPQEGSEYLLDKVEDGIRYRITPDLEIIKSEEIEKGGPGLEKAGEGSRGGKVIGHTKSGKPIYAGDKVRYEHKNYIAHSHDKKSKTIYLARRDGKTLAQDHKGDNLQVHESLLEHAPKGNDDSLWKPKIGPGVGPLSKAMTAGTATGTDTTDKLTTGETLKEESLEGAKETQTKKKKKSNKVLTKGEIYNKIFSSFNLDNVDQAKKIYTLIERVQQRLDHGKNNRRSS